MVKCWTRSGGRGAGEGSDSAHFPAKAFWICLSALLLLVAMAMGLIGYLALTGPGSTSLQTVRLTAPDQTGVLLNQTAVLDPQNHLVTLSITAAGNQTSTVLFDVKHGLICYQPADQQRCFLQTMERSDYDQVGSLLSGPQNQAESVIRSGPVRFQQRPGRGTMVTLWLSKGRLFLRLDSESGSTPGRRPAVWERDAEADAVPGRDGGRSGGRGLAGRAAPDAVSGQNRPPDPQDRRPRQTAAGLLLHRHLLPQQHLCVGVFLLPA